MPNAASLAFLTDLTTKERFPAPLGEWVRAELDAGLGPLLDRLALAAALEGVCGIPKIHRVVKSDPTQAALMLAKAALETLHHWWPKEHRAPWLAKAEAAAAEGNTERVLSYWCSWRSTERAKRLADAQERHLQAAA